MDPLEAIRTALDVAVTAVVPGTYWFWKRGQKKEHRRIEEENVRLEAIAERKALVLHRQLTAHEELDTRRFEQLAAENTKIIQKLQESEELRSQQHFENSVRLEQLPALVANVSTLMQWFSEWRRKQL